MKALSSYFAIKDTELLRVEKLYEHFLKADSNLIIEDTAVDKRLFSDDESKYNSLIENTAYNGTVNTILNNQASAGLPQKIFDTAMVGFRLPNNFINGHQLESLLCLFE